MIIFRFLIPFLYSVMLGSVWSMWSGKKFSSSLAPAFMTHILLIFFSGLIFNRLSIGIYAGIIITFIMFTIYIVKNLISGKNNSVNILNYSKDLWNNGLMIFTFLYIFCFITNQDKKFISWDEFSHWGMFLKESLRLDSFYCNSPLYFAHKDYVPSITLFETLWCRLSLRFSESDAYRAIQIFMYAMLLPMFEHFSECKDKLIRFCAVAFVSLVQLIFSTATAFFFYHSIYPDVAVGILFYWCVYEAYRKNNDDGYQLAILTIGLSVLVLSKMTAMALLPLVVVMIIAKHFFISQKRPTAKYCLLMIPAFSIPIALWMAFNKYVENHLGKSGKIQSYGGMSLTSVKDVFFSFGNSPISYLDEVKHAYIDALFHRDVLIHGTYIAIFSTIIILFFFMANYEKNDSNKKKIKFAGIWSLGTGIFHTLLMYFLYATQFDEYEAVHVCSYERYMGALIISLLLFLIAIYYESEIWKTHTKVYYMVVLFLAADLAFLHPEAFDQALPGSITQDDEENAPFTSESSTIINSTTENDKIFIIRRDGSMEHVWKDKYYCSPRVLEGGSIGPDVKENGDSFDMSVSEFIETLKKYDYIFFIELDDVFKHKYSEAFYDPSLLESRTIHKIKEIDSKIRLE